jgi:hypothetical protein
VLDELICDAIVEAGVPRADPRKQGHNEGMLLSVASAVLEAQIRLLLRLARMRLGPADPAIESALKQTKDLERVERMAEAVLTAASWQELLSIP